MRSRKIDHAREARAFVADQEHTKWHNEAVAYLRTKRDLSVQKVSDWEQLRQQASDIKEHVLSHLGSYLHQFEAAAIANGATVHWAATAEEHNRIVLDILQRHGAKLLVKSKSMLTEECHLNQSLEHAGIEVVDTDLGERIIQWRGERPSHIVAPAIHLRKEDVGDLFHERLDTPAGLTDPTLLTAAARAHLRQQFIVADAALTGVNFAVAENGTVVVCTNEGNADMGVHVVPLQIHCMGLEKIIPRMQDLGIFTRLLARSGTGQPITIYTSHYKKPKPDGQMHIVIVDNGRSRHLKLDDFRNALKCIRCGACINTCPVYRRSGGYSYGDAIPGPIGSILTPGIDLEKYRDLPFASSLCGACSDVCPVKIDIHKQLYQWRQVVGERKLLPWFKRLSLQLTAAILAYSGRYALAGRLLRWTLRTMPGLLTNRFNPYTRGRRLPEPPKESFQDWYRKQSGSRS